MDEQPQQDENVWLLKATQASLCTPKLTAEIDLLRPTLGLTQLTIEGQQVAGHLLAVLPGAETEVAPGELLDAFVRGCDLVATYAQTQSRPFRLQVYWRVSANSETTTVDAILSLQTDLLESFPGVAVQTKLPGDSACSLFDSPTRVTDLQLSTGQAHSLQNDCSDGVLLRSAEYPWSYAEVTHPEDRGESIVSRLDENHYQLQKQLGGAFLEKGVIRRLRVRGVMLSSTDDLTTAADSLASLATEEPPLTV